MHDQPPRPFHFSVLKLLVFMGVLCVVCILLYPAIQAAREAERRQACTNNLKQIGMALHNYHDAFGCFPPPFSTDASGKPLRSWRVAILDFLSSRKNFQRSFD